jgi:hypothetical protein
MAVTIATIRMICVCAASLMDQGCRRGTDVVRKTVLGPSAESNFLD